MAVGEPRAGCARWGAVVMSRLVAVSKRVGSLRGTTRAGGLAVALAEALQTRHGRWFGWSGEVTENTEAQVKQQTTAGVTRATVSLTRDEHHDYYNGFANACLWPLFHYRLDLTSFDRRFYDRYQRVNRRFRSEEHTSELQSLMRISYAVFCLKKKKLSTKYKNTSKISR